MSDSKYMSASVSSYLNQPGAGTNPIGGEHSQWPAGLRGSQGGPAQTLPGPFAAWDSWALGSWEGGCGNSSQKRRTMESVVYQGGKVGGSLALKKGSDFQ